MCDDKICVLLGIVALIAFGPAGCTLSQKIALQRKWLEAPESAIVQGGGKEILVLVQCMALTKCLVELLLHTSQEGNLQEGNLAVDPPFFSFSVALSSWPSFLKLQSLLLWLLLDPHDQH